MFRPRRSIREQSEQDHELILADVRDAFAQAEEFSSSVRWNGGLDTYDGFFTQVMYHQLRILRSATQLGIMGSYIESFALIRTVFENYFLTLLMSLGTKYEVKDPKTGNVVVKTGVSPASGQGEPIPLIWFNWKEYDPEWHHLRSPYVKDFFTDDIAEERGREYHKELYYTFLTFGRIRRALKLNDLLDEENDARVEVHYNFLSSFVHMTSAGMERLSGNVERYEFRNLDDVQNYQSLLCELALLYVIHLLSMYLDLVVQHFQRRKVEVVDRESFVKIVEFVGSKYSFFWFIFNKPSEIDDTIFKQLNFM